MSTFLLTRKEMADLLMALKEEKPPVQVLQEAWKRINSIDLSEKKTLSNLFAASLPPIYEKIMKITKMEKGFSLNEIVQLGMQIENTNFSLTAIQNWVKRDIKEIIVSPKKGKKYSLEQTALLFLVEDLKTALDFDSIRKLLKLIINDPEDDHDDLVNPVHLYAYYSALFERLNKKGIGFGRHTIGMDSITAIEKVIKEEADQIMGLYPEIPEENKEAIRNAIVIATLSVFTAYFQMLAKRYVTSTLFLQGIDL